MLFFGFHGPTLAYTKAIRDGSRAESAVFDVRFSMRGTARVALLQRMRLSQEAQMRAESVAIQYSKVDRYLGLMASRTLALYGGELRGALATRALVAIYYMDHVHYVHCI